MAHFQALILAFEHNSLKQAFFIYFLLFFFAEKCLAPTLSTNIGVQIKPVFQTRKIGQILALKEKKPPIVKIQISTFNCKFQCDPCDADYVGYTARHLHQRINEHKYSAIVRHFEQHGLLKADLVDKQSSVLKKCRSKFDCLIFEMLFIKELNPKLNTQKDSFRAKLFT